MLSQGKYELASLQNPRDAFSNNKEKIRRMQENAIFLKRKNKKETNPRKVYFTSWTPDVAVTSKGTREKPRYSHLSLKKRRMKRRMDRFQLRKKKMKKKEKKTRFVSRFLFLVKTSSRKGRPKRGVCTRTRQENQNYRTWTTLAVSLAFSLLKKDERNAPASHCLLLKIALHSLCVKK